VARRHLRVREDATVTADDTNTRPLEPGVRRDFSSSLSYGAYLHLDELLGAQHTLSVPPQHDELLFIIQHQTTELWLKLVLHELRSARDLLRADDLAPALKRLARVKHIQKTLTEQWSVLATLTPTEYAEFRGFLSTSSGFQSWQYRAVEFILGNKHADMLRVFDHDPAAQAVLGQLLHEPGVYDEFLAYIHRRGLPVPAELLDRDWTQAHRFNAELVPTFTHIYEHAHELWHLYEACEELVDLEENFQLWRFRHLKTVERTIGSKRGTGGSSGVPFLRRALELTFFPELYAVRAEIGTPAP
jgi:tryptophan 2,3-dioxygenase